VILIENSTGKLVVKSALDENESFMVKSRGVVGEKWPFGVAAPLTVPFSYDPEPEMLQEMGLTVSFPHDLEPKVLVKLTITP
jgi:hypothetical protein